MTSSGFEKRAKQNMKQPQNVGRQVCCLEENMPCPEWMDDSRRTEELGGGLLQAAMQGWREQRRPWAPQRPTTATCLLPPSCANSPSYLQ